MKHIYYLALGALLLTACGKQKENTESSDSTKVENPTGENEVQESEAPETVYKINIKHLKEYKLFEYKSVTKNIYHENTYTVDWPMSAEGFDVTILQNELKKWMGIDQKQDVEKYIKEWAKTEGPEGGDYPLTEVKKESELTDSQKAAAEECQEDPYEYQYSTERSQNVEMLSNDSINHIVTFQERFINNVGSGVGAGVFYGYTYFTFDYESMKVVNLKDIVSDEKTVVKQMKTQNKDADYEGLPNVTDLPSAWYISGNSLVFVFGKYEISFGADGCPNLYVNMKKCPKALTEYGKKLLGIE